MKINSFTLKMVLIGIVFVVASCTQSPPPSEKVVALVNRVAITMADIEREINNLEVTKELLPLLQEYANGDGFYKIIKTDEDLKELIEHWGYDPYNLTEEQKVFFNRLKYTYSFLLTKNEILNKLIRREVQYQEALRRGYKVSEDEAYDREKDIISITQQSYIERGEEEAWLKFQELREKTWQLQGFKSEDDFLKSRLPYLARSYTIVQLEREFKEKIEASLTDRSLLLDPFIEIENAWQDYTEELIREAEVEILAEEFTLWDGS